MIGDVIYQREECLAQASTCREKAQADPVRNDYWIDQAIVWLQRAMQSAITVAVVFQRELHVQEEKDARKAIEAQAS